MSQKYCACHTKRFSTFYETRLNVTKCHACHAKRSYATLETSKSVPFCRTYHRHGHTALTRTVANGCGRKRNVEWTHPQPPDPQSEAGTFATHSGRTQHKLLQLAFIGAETTMSDRAVVTCGLWFFQSLSDFSPQECQIASWNIYPDSSISVMTQCGLLWQICWKSICLQERDPPLERIFCLSRCKDVSQCAWL